MGYLHSPVNVLYQSGFFHLEMPTSLVNSKTSSAEFHVIWNVIRLSAIFTSKSIFMPSFFGSQSGPIFSISDTNCSRARVVFCVFQKHITWRYSVNRFFCSYHVPVIFSNRPIFCALPPTRCLHNPYADREILAFCPCIVYILWEALQICNTCSRNLYLKTVQAILSWACDATNLST